MISDNIYNYLKNKKILILGFGREGKSTYNLIRKYDKNMNIGIADMKEITDDDVIKDSNVIFHIGDNYLDSCLEYDLVIKGPGVIIKDYFNDEVKKKITCQTDLFIRFCPNKTIGITGTKGKSTTSSLMYHILKSVGVNSIFMGNIGIPCFDVVDQIEEDMICVLELGCHQLEYMKHSPNISVILNIYEEHLDHYSSLNAYIEAKENIYKYQNDDDYVILGSTELLNNKIDTVSKKIVFEKKDNNCFYIDDRLNMIINNESISLFKNDIETKLQGDHNYYNILVCLIISKILDLDLNRCIKTISTFEGLPHRLQFVGTFDGITYYDDSIATSIPSVVNAVGTLKNVGTIIVGGMDRGLDYNPLVEYLNSSSVDNILLLPSTNNRIYDLFVSLKTTKNVIKVNDMEEAVSYGKRITEKGKVCLLSPAAASYGFYKNFEERGDHFQELIKK